MLALLGPLGALLGHEATTIKAKLKRQIVLWSTLCMLGIVALVFVLVATNNALTATVGSVVAPLIIAGTALLSGLVVFAIFHWRGTLEAHEEADRKRQVEMTALVTTAAITALPLILPTLKRVGVPAGGVAAAAIYSLLRNRTSQGDD